MAHPELLVSVGVLHCTDEAETVVLYMYALALRWASILYVDVWIVMLTMLNLCSAESHNMVVGPVSVQGPWSMV